MGVRHRELPAEGVQFHPESVLTPEGKRLLANFLEGQTTCLSFRGAHPPMSHARTNESSPARSTRSASGSHLTADHASAVLDEIMEGRAERGAGGGVPDRAAREGRDRRRDRRARADDAPARRRRVERSRATWSTRPGPGEGRRPSTSRPLPRSSRPAPAALSPSTATARAPAARARPICSRRWA